MLDEVRRRVQQDTLGHRGHKSDPLYRIRNLLRHGAEHLTGRQVARLDAALAAGDPDWQVTIAWQCYQQLRSIYHAPTQAAGADIAAKVVASLPTCPIPEVARLGRTLRAWRAQLMAYFVTERISNGGTEAINLIIEKTRRLAHGFRNFNNYRLRLLLVADGPTPDDPRAMLSDEEPPLSGASSSPTAMADHSSGSIQVLLVSQPSTARSNEHYRSRRRRPRLH